LDTRGGGSARKTEKAAQIRRFMIYTAPPKNNYRDHMGKACSRQDKDDKYNRDNYEDLRIILKWILKT
jgi:hypothetical protein